MGIILFVVAILFVVMVHEAGHFAVAKAFGFKATMFFVGFGPTLWSTTRGETEYGVKAFPIGGFVKIIGMNPYEQVPPEDEPRAYPSKPRWQRALLILAGSATHWPVAFLILTITAMTIGFPTGESTNEIAVVQTTIDEQATPASEAGFRPGDEVVGVGGEETTSWIEIRRYIREHAGEPATFEVVRGDEHMTIEATPGTAIFNNEGTPVAYAAPGEEARPLREGETKFGFLGVEPEPEYQQESLLGAIGTGTRFTWDTTVLAWRGIGETFNQIFGGELWAQLTGQEERGSGSAFGLVGAGRLANESVNRGRYINLIALIVGFTIFVGLMNLLPLPPLDGGHLAVLIYESITRRTVDIRKLIPIAVTVISFFVILFLAVLYLDVAKPIKVPF